MNVTTTSLPGVLVLAPTVHADARGAFLETYRRDRYRELGIDADFVQDNASSSVHGTLRGLHYQLEHPQGKLVWVTLGEVYDVVVDLRRGSPTFGRWYGTYLTADNHLQLWVPPGFAHGFVVTGERAHVSYKVTAFYSRSDERAIRWNDPDLAIAWPLGGDPLLSERDRGAPWLREAVLPRERP